MNKQTTPYPETDSTSPEQHTGLLELKALNEQRRAEADERILKSNDKIMHSNVPGGMAYQFSMESWGGNAGNREINGVRVTQAAANFIADTDTGEIVTFTNYPDDYDRLRSEGFDVTRLTFIKAMSMPRFHGNELRCEKVEGWSRPDTIVGVVADLKSFDASSELTDFLPERAAANLQASIDAFNSEERPFVIGPEG